MIKLLTRNQFGYMFLNQLTGNLISKILSILQKPLNRRSFSLFFLCYCFGVRKFYQEKNTQPRLNDFLLKTNSTLTTIPSKLQGNNCLKIICCNFSNNKYKNTIANVRHILSKEFRYFQKNPSRYLKVDTQFNIVSTTFFFPTNITIVILTYFSQEFSKAITSINEYEVCPLNIIILCS